MSLHQPHAPQKHRCWASLFNTRAVAYEVGKADGRVAAGGLGGDGTELEFGDSQGSRAPRS